MPCRLAIVSSHPIQYNAPAFRALASDRRLCVKVFYGWDGPGKSVDPEFGHAVSWDIPLLDGYDHAFIPNESRDPGTHRFGGLKNPRMVQEIQEWKPDVILVYGWSFDSHLRVMRAFKGKLPILFRGDSTLLGDRSLTKQFARRTFLRWVFDRIDLALYVGKRNKEYYLEMGLDDSQLVWAPHAIDNDRFADEDGTRETAANAWRTRLGIDRSDIVFLFAGKLITRKDPFTLMKAFLQLDRQPLSRRAHLIFAGEGELRRGLEDASRGRDDIHFIGFQNQSSMPVVYRLGDAMVLPSLIDTWGLAVNESMACSRPVIVSDLVGCAPDLVRPGDTGEVFRNGDSNGLANILSRMANEPAKIREMGLAARRLIEGWSIDVYARTVSEVARTVSSSSSGSVGT
jgi:glycosyltransferase involved in cell wall biosynthesis